MDNLAGLVVVPTYNEVENLELLVDSILDMGDFHVLVVDDASPDGTGALADRLGRRFRGRMDVLHRAGKLGLGTAYLQGFGLGLERGYPHLFQMDADFSHDPAVLCDLLAALQGGADLAIGSRYTPGGRTENWSAQRLALSRAGSLYARTILGLPIRDLTGGFRGWRAEGLRRIGLQSVRSEGYAFQIEMAYRCARGGGVIVEIPITFAERRLGASKMSREIALEAALMVWRLRLEGANLPGPLRQVLIGR